MKIKSMNRKNIASQMNSLNLMEFLSVVRKIISVDLTNSAS